MNSDLDHDSACFACGSLNPHGLHLNFLRKNEHEVHCFFKPSQHHQSYPETLHGGIQALILDAAMMAQAAKMIGFDVVTGKMKIKYHQKVCLDNSIEIIGEVTNKHDSYFVIESKIFQDGILKTSASGMYKKYEQSN